jgi:hypothetical protein
MDHVFSVCEILFAYSDIDEVAVRRRLRDAMVVADDIKQDDTKQDTKQKEIKYRKHVELEKIDDVTDEEVKEAIEEIEDEQEFRLYLAMMVHDAECKS